MVGRLSVLSVDSLRAPNASANSYTSRILTSLRYNLPRSSAENADRRDRAPTQIGFDSSIRDFRSSQ